MKNIHILPTDKPSRLWINNLLQGKLELNEEALPFNTSQHIYITSDEEIKEEDWCYYLNNHGGGNIVAQAYKHSEDERMLFDDGTYNRKIGEGITPLIGECKKIMLTTDQDLIDDGVQAIDYEFLEWFVKNPSCEEVEVTYGVLKPFESENKGYLIHCPDNEPLEEPKQETFEEAAKNTDKSKCKHFRREHTKIEVYDSFEEGFIEGAKWQQERMYSEEDILDAWELGAKEGLPLTRKKKEELFEQFKKK